MPSSRELKQAAGDVRAALTARAQRRAERREANRRAFHTPEKQQERYAILVRANQERRRKQTETGE
jgi:hypothetical protein